MACVLDGSGAGPHFRISVSPYIGHVCVVNDAVQREEDPLSKLRCFAILTWNKQCTLRHDVRLRCRWSLDPFNAWQEQEMVLVGDS